MPHPPPGRTIGAVGPPDRTGRRQTKPMPSAAMPPGRHGYRTLRSPRARHRSDRGFGLQHRGNVRFPIRETTLRVYSKMWEMCALAGFLNGREAARVMVPRGRGTILFTGATASVRGGSGFSAFAGGKAALRALAQSMARELGPEGIHVAHVVIDGATATERTRSRAPDKYETKKT